jgi:hypothetical protein
MELCKISHLHKAINVTGYCLTICALKQQIEKMEKENLKNEKIISEIKEKLIGKSYSEIQDILVTVQGELMEEAIYSA